MGEREKKIKIEVLYSEIANLFGEIQNVNYLKQCLPDAEVIYTALHDVPAFSKGEATLVYMGAMTEMQQEMVIKALTPYKNELISEIDKGTIFLMTGNAMEVMEQYIENEDGSRIEGLGIFNTHAKRDMMNRYNSLILGEFEGIKLVGFKAQFSHSYHNDVSKRNDNDYYFFDVIRGDGLEPGTKKEGLRKNNFFGTYTVGPFLVYNPLFVKYLFKLMGREDAKLAHESAIMAAYEKRLAEFEDEKLRYQ